MAWDPKTYLDFEDERTRPAVELLARVPNKTPERVIDLGCGPGNSTALLARRWPKAKLEGLDSSEPMLDQARRSGIAAQWISSDIPGWAPQKRYDVIFSNACFQWVAGHDVLLSRLMSYLEKGGSLAFQVPGNLYEASHAAMREIAARHMQADKLAEVRDVVLEPPERYYEILEPHAAQIDIWETTYLHVLNGEDAVFRWVSGTGLRPFLNALQGETREDFVRDYKARLNDAYPMRKSGKTLFPFRRIFAVARK